MKKFLLLFFIFLNLTIIKAQEGKLLLSKENLIPYVYNVDSVENTKVFLNANNELQFIRIIDSTGLTKEQTFNKVLSFFTYNYGSGKSVLQVQDKDAGQIIGKGLYSDFALNTFPIQYMMSEITYYYTFSAYHIIQVDIKENRMRIILTVQGIDESVSNIYAPKNTISKIVGDLSPFKKSKAVTDRKLRGLERYNNEVIQGEEKSERIAFKELCKKCKATLVGIEKNIFDKSNDSKVSTDTW